MDLIDRQAAIDECYPVTVDGEVYEVVQVETLMGLPSVQPQSTMGQVTDVVQSTNGCISRQAAIDAVQEELNKQERSRLLNIWTTAEVRFTIVELILKQLPTAEPKTGRWKSDRLVSTNGGTYGVRRCSECEAYYQDIGYGWNYCPNCGTRMGGEDNEAD